jgi:hypothetical protein
MVEGPEEAATFRGEGFGRLSSSRDVKWHGSYFYRTSSASTGKLAFLNDVVEYLKLRSMLLGMEVAAPISLTKYEFWLIVIRSNLSFYNQY